jgi:hypothetical protein
MEKKRLGRGLEDIADLFISQKGENVSPHDSQPESTREMVAEGCPGRSHEDPKERMTFSEDDVITVIGERLKVTRNCLRSERPLAQNLSGKEGGFRGRNRETTAEDCRDGCEVTEHVASKKKIKYLNTPDVQQKMVKSLSRHLDHNYQLRKIELVKLNEISRPGMKKMIEENILIYVQEEESH